MKERLPFIDWMKCLGMLIIVYGHTAGAGLIEFTAPFNPKQLGVAFFVFVMGFSLARETRPTPRTIYNRYFEMTLFGWLAAILVSLSMWITSGDLAESNYAPLVLGANVLLDYFPANPTTWFIGTYLHLLLFWAITRRFNVPLWVLPATFLVEIAVRTLLLEYVANYTAYMLVTNWIGAFLLGTYIGQRPLAPTSTRKAVLATGALAVIAIAWPLLTTGLDAEDSFPFRRLAGPLVWTTAAISLL
jgi:fucose 4-O-acetylase-like acetyltransferase